MFDVYVKQVFGVSKDMVQSYIEREEIDGKFKEALQSDKHMVIYRSPKQGKSALVQKHIKKEESITINCTPKMDTKDMYSSLLRQVGIEIESSMEKITGTSGELSVKTGFKAIIPFFGEANTDITAKTGGNSSNKISYKTIEFIVSLFRRNKKVKRWLLIFGLKKSSSFRKI